MTDCSEQMTFEFYEHKQLTCDFKGGQISSDAGLLVVRELEQKLGWLPEAASLLSDPRHPERTEHGLVSLLRQRVLGIVAGYEDCNDHDRMRTDPVLKLTCQRGPQEGPLASQPTLSRLENWVSARDVVRLDRRLVGHYIDLHAEEPPDQIIIDVDPTDDPCHGHQQLALFNRFYDQRIYLPLLIFERHSGMLLGVRLRAGNAGGADRLVALLRPMVRALKEAFPRTRIILRADAGLAGPRLYDYCEGQGLLYLIGIPAYEPFKRHVRFDAERMKERHRRTGRPARHYSSRWHRAESWPVKRRVLYKVEVGPKGTDCRFVVTNMKGLPIHLYRLYCDRGTAETFIDELKNGLRAGRLSCSRFVANAFRLVLFALAYNLLRVLRGKLADTVLEGASVQTVRSHLLKLGARIRQTFRRVWVHIAGGFPLRRALAVALRRIQAMPNAPPAGA
ncbi:MAG: IS1380 family transposase [Planctomycetota bacterium]